MTKTFLIKNLPQFFSVILHPLLMPLLGLLILFHSGTYYSFLPPEFKNSLYLIVGICTLAIPLICIPFFFYRGLITNIQMDTEKERIGPLSVTLIIYFVTYYILRNASVPDQLQLFLLGSSFCVLADLIITLKWKISAHMIGLGGIVGLIVMISWMMHSNVLGYLILFLALSGITGTSRLLLNSHTPAQVYAGFAAGFLIMAATLFIF